MDDVVASIDEQDAAKVIGTSLLGRKDVGLPGSGALSTPCGRQSIALCR